MSADFSTEVLQVRREWHDIFVLKVIKWENLKYRVLYLAKLSFRSEREITNFTDSYEEVHMKNKAVYSLREALGN